MLVPQHNTSGGSSLLHNVADAVGAVIATSAATSPWWRDHLHLASTFATEFAPILGVIWLTVQIIHRVSHWTKPTEPDDA
jgi:hypothetical protein